MLVKELVKVLKPGSEVIVTYTSKGQQVDVIRTTGSLSYEKYLLELKVVVMYVSEVDSKLHIITSQ